jgi:hypothetical protein
MSYLTYQNKRVVSQNKYVSNIAVVIPGQIYWTGAGGLVEMGTIFPVEVSANATVKMGIYLDSSAATFNMQIYDPSINNFMAISYGTIPETSEKGLTVQTRNSPSIQRKFYDFSAYLNQQVVLEVVKTATGITSVKANNNTLTSTGNGFFDLGISGKVLRIGGTSGMSVWDWEIVGTHKWIGYPYGDTLAAWEDTIGSYDAQFFTGSPGTRNLF